MNTKYLLPAKIIFTLEKFQNTFITMRIGSHHKTYNEQSFVLLLGYATFFLKLEKKNVTNILR